MLPLGTQAPSFRLPKAGGKLVYRGQLHGSRQGNSNPVSSGDLRAALDTVLAVKPASADQWLRVGCNIKWKRGSEPKYR
jgi:hypothetical protein